MSSTDYIGLLVRFIGDLGAIYRCRLCVGNRESRFYNHTVVVDSLLITVNVYRLLLLCNTRSLSINQT